MRWHLAWTRQASLYAVAGLALAVAGAWAGRLLPAAFGGTLLLVVAVESALASGRMPHVALQVSASRVPEGQPVDVAVECSRAGRDTQLQVRLDPAIAVPEGSNVVGGGPSRFAARCDLRGPRAIGPVQVRLWSPTRLWAREAETGAAHTVEVLPSSMDAKRVGLLSRTLKPVAGRFQVNRPGQGFDFFALRGYAPGDTIRDVNWKASARQEDLVVNQRQRETLTEMTILVDARLVGGAGVPGQSPLDRSCRVALGLYAQAARARDVVHLAAYGEDLTRLQRNASVHDCESLLARLDAGGRMTLDVAWRELSRDVRGTGPVLVLSSLEADPTAGHAFADMRARGHPVTLLSPQPKGPTWESPAGARRRADREDRLASARAVGVVVVDWKPGSPIEADKPRQEIFA
jgi:uncharacterized protein (DUF58 family)